MRRGAEAGARPEMAAAGESGGPDAPRARDEADVLLEVRDLCKHFPVRRGVLRRRVGEVRAVDGVSFEIRAGETLGLVGESGSGKSTTGRAVLRLTRPSSGRVIFEGDDLATMAADRLRQARRDMQMIFQDPYSSLNPRMRVADIVREPLRIHGMRADGDVVAALLDRVGLDRPAGRRFPHELSGGQRQRVAIARALATGPKLVVADEPVSALDVSIQAQIINLMADLKEERRLTYLFIAHDLSMVRHISDRVAVMYLGKIVETGDREAVFRRPSHPYTRALIASIPAPLPGRPAVPAGGPMEGDMPSPANPPSGCRFRTRCAFATELCSEREPQLREIGDPRRREPWEPQPREADFGEPGPSTPDASEAEMRKPAPRKARLSSPDDTRARNRVACHHAEEIAKKISSDTTL